MDPEHPDPERVLRQRCARHGLSPEAGTRLLPLVRRALRASPALRRRLLRIVDAVLAADAERPHEEKTARRGSAPARVHHAGCEEAGRDEDSLLAVAALLHRWGGEPDRR